MSPANNCVTSWENRILDRNTNDTVRRIDFTKNRFYNFPMQAYYILFPKIMYSKITSIYYESSSHLKTEWPSLIYIAITRDLTRETYASIKLLCQTFITLRTRTICLPHQTWQGIYSALLINFIVCLRQKTSKASPCY